ncbi:alpha/beta fold hydrolase [Streptomyces sp. NBC_01433]|uniref:thioesterase II family protein n=1 Tax=Streptomyces sp. NBC_01433 TaxID=2903864 RepID=UPI0022516ADD|nr:alpha/beta fold hydrolase [Streptomyces sp. NBC_01433]MCX4680622.1 alpha/beta fold hydrolase [Streptomyces sp. NBC_01433]
MSVRLFCLPYAGASARMYEPWARQLAPSVVVTPVELPGRGSRGHERPAAGAEALLRDLTGFVTRLCDRPFALFGHGLGALLAYEIAARLEWRHDRVAERLYVSGQGAPRPGAGTQELSRLPHEPFLDRVRELYGSARRTFADPEAIGRVLPLMRADFAIAEAYRARTEDVLHCPVTALGGRGDASADRARLAGWRAHTRRHCRVRILPGDHLFPHTAGEQVIDMLAADLSGPAGFRPGGGPVRAYAPLAARTG